MVRGGRYAVHALRGPYSGIHDAFRRLFGKWLPTSGEEVDDRPCLELHMSRPTEVPESERLTKVCVPLRNKSPRSTTELTPDARAVGPVPGVVIGSSEGARQIRRRLRQALETRR
jgi:hypothetical protein